MKNKFIVIGILIILCLLIFTLINFLHQKRNVQNLAVQENNEIYNKNNKDINNIEENTRLIKMTIDNQDQEVIIRLNNSQTANELYSKLPLRLTFEDFNNIEKIAYMDSELEIKDDIEEYNPVKGDFCLYEPWGNLSIFYKDFRNSSGLIPLGKIESNIEILENLQDNFSVTIEAL